MVGTCFFQFPVGISYISDIFRYMINGWNTWHVLLKDIQDHEQTSPWVSGRIRITSGIGTIFCLHWWIATPWGATYIGTATWHTLKGGDMWNIDNIWRKMEERIVTILLNLWLYAVQKEYESWKSGRFAGRVPLLLSCSALFNCLCCMFCKCKWDNSLI